VKTYGPASSVTVFNAAVVTNNARTATTTQSTDSDADITNVDETDTITNGGRFSERQWAAIIYLCIFAYLIFM